MIVPGPLLRKSLSGLGDRACQFVTRPASARPLAALRIGLSAVLLMQAAALASALPELYGDLGYVQWPITQVLVPAGAPKVSWLIEALRPLGISPEWCVRGVFLAYVTGLGCLLLGWHTRVSAVAAWLGHLTLCVSGSAGVYGVDTFARIALFYCVVMPVGHAASLDLAAGRVHAGPSFSARLGLRVLQIHLCIVYLAAGVAKASGEQWWTGEAIWLALNQPTLAQFDTRWLAQAPWLARVACWGTVAVEAGYAVFIWPRRTRLPWALLTVLLHVGTAVGLGLTSFAAVMIVLNVSAFLVSAEPVPGADRTGNVDQTLAVTHTDHPATTTLGTPASRERSERSGGVCPTSE
jgi:hypothetical protein